MAAPLILILGGVRSGRSEYVEKLATKLGQHALYITTAEAKGEEMAEHIATHRLH